MNFRSMKTKLITLMIALIAIPLIVLGISSLNMFKKETEESVSAKLYDMVYMTKDIIQGEYDKATLITQLIGGDHSITEFISGNTEFRDEAYEILQNHYKQQNDIVDSLVLTDNNAQALMTDTNPNVNLDLTDRAYLGEALEGRVGISDVIQSKLTNIPVIAIASPVYKDNEIVGAVIASVKFSNISEYVRSIKVFDTGYAYLYNSEGLTLSHIDPEMEFQVYLNKQGIPELEDMIVDFNNDVDNEKFYTFNGVYKYVRYAKVGNIGLAVTANYDDYMSANNAVAKSVIIILVSSLLLAIVIAYIFTQSLIVKPLRNVKDSMVKAGTGDLTVYSNVNQKDEIGDISASFNKMIAKIKNLLMEINQASDQVASGSDQVSQSSLSLSQGATEQASSVEELSSSIEEIASMARDNTKEANTASTMTLSAQEYAETGNGQMTNMLAAMEEIKDSSNNISKIIKVIDDIAFQTNILALNAAVEAARAGQHGKGFAVVAEEVRNLASRSAAAAKETTDLINGSVDKVNEGMSIAQGSADALHSIVEEVSKVTNLITGIAKSSDEQLSGIEQINMGIEQISEVIQSTSAVAEETAAASEELSSQADLLKSQIASFKTEQVADHKKTSEKNQKFLSMDL